MQEQNRKKPSELAQKVLALEIGGHSDWGIPAHDKQGGRHA